MEHNEAMEKMMTERYLLGELLEEDRDAFEEHFFGCTECASAVRYGATMLDSGRALERVPIAAATPPRRRGMWWTNVAAAAAGIFFTVAGYERIILPPIKAAFQTASQPRITELLSLPTVERGTRADVTIAVARPGEPIGLYFVPEDGTHPRYRCEVRDAGGKGKVRFAQVIDAAQASHPLLLTIPPGALPEGEYELTVSGEPRRDGASAVTSYPFRIRRP